MDNQTADEELATTIRDYMLRPQHWTTYGECPSVEELAAVIGEWNEEFAKSTDPVFA